MRETIKHTQEAWSVSIKMNPNRPTPRYITIKMAEFKDRKILKAAREKPLAMYKRALIKLISQQKHYKPEWTGM